MLPLCIRALSLSFIMSCGSPAGAALSVDLFCASSEDLQSSLVVALSWSVAWIGVALLFNVGIWYVYGTEWALLFLAGYALEVWNPLSRCFLIPS